MHQMRTIFSQSIEIVKNWNIYILSIIVYYIVHDVKGTYSNPWYYVDTQSD